MLEYRVTARRLDAAGSAVAAKEARLVVDTGTAGRLDAFNPAELLLASLAACIIKGAERVTPLLQFDLTAIEVELHGVRQDSPPKMLQIDYVVTVDTPETDDRLALLLRNIQKYGTIHNTLAGAVTLVGVIRRRA